MTKLCLRENKLRWVVLCVEQTCDNNDDQSLVQAMIEVKIERKLDVQSYPNAVEQ